MSGNPPIERLISVDIEGDGVEPVVGITSNGPKDTSSRSLAKTLIGGGEVNGNCVIDEGYDTIQTYQGTVHRFCLT